MEHDPPPTGGTTRSGFDRRAPDAPDAAERADELIGASRPSDKTEYRPRFAAPDPPEDHL